MEDSYNDMLAELTGLIEEIVHTAMEDSVISEDEEALITEIKQRIEDLKLVLSISLENAEDLDALDKVFSESLKNLVSQSIDVAKKDEVISVEEIEILKKVIALSDKYSD